MNAMEKPRIAETMRNLLKGNEIYFPTNLYINYPQIVEKIGILWNDPELLHPYFMELTTSDRQNRAGFPPEILHEILVLSNFYSTIHPRSQQGDDFWPVTR